MKAVLKIQKDSLGNGVDTILALIDDERWRRKKKKTHGLSCGNLHLR